MQTLVRVFLALCLVSISLAAITVPAWQPSKDTRANRPGNRGEHTCTIFNNSLHVISGYNGKLDIKSDHYVYDFGSEAWEKLSTENVPKVFGHTAFVVNEDLYIFGGQIATFAKTNDLYKFVKGARSFTKVDLKSSNGQLPRERSMAESVVLPDGRVFIFGGALRDGSNCKEAFLLNVNEATWEPLALNFPQEFKLHGLQGHKLALIGNTIYVIGGVDEQSNKYLTEIYAINTSTWEVSSVHAAFPSRAFHSIIVKDNLVYVIGGGAVLSYNSPTSDELLIFNTENNELKVVKKSKLSSRVGHCSVLHNGKAYLFAGGKHARQFDNEFFTAEFVEEAVEPVVAKPVESSSSTAAAATTEKTDETEQFLHEIDSQLEEYRILERNAPRLSQELNDVKKDANETIAKAVTFPSIDDEFKLWEEIVKLRNNLTEQIEKLKNLLDSDSYQIDGSSSTSIEKAQNDAANHEKELTTVLNKYNALKNLTSDEENIKKLENDIKVCNENTQTLDSTIKEKKSSVDGIKKKIANLKDNLKTAKDKLNNLKMTKKDRRTTTKDLKSKLSRENETLATEQKQFNEKKESINGLQKELDELERDLSAKKKQQKDLEAIKEKMEGLDDEFEKLKQIGDKYNHELNDALSKLPDTAEPLHTSQFSAEHRTLAQKVAIRLVELKQSIDALEEKVKATKDNLYSLRKASSQIELRINNVNSILNQLKAQKKRRKQDVADLKAQIAIATTEVKNAEDAHKKEEENLSTTMLEISKKDQQLLFEKENCTRLANELQTAQTELNKKHTELVQLKKDLKESYEMFKKSKDEFSEFSKKINEANQISMKSTKNYRETIAAIEIAQQDIKKNLERTCKQQREEIARLREEIAALKQQNA